VRAYRQAPIDEMLDRVGDLELAEIEYSIILERARIVNLDVRIESSLVGRDALITRSDQKPRAIRFMVGDSSQIWVL
jgi:glucose-1-phosphate thymidylyltransferase